MDCWDFLYEQGQCCGIDGPEDWESHAHPIPCSCCKNENQVTHFIQYSSCFFFLMGEKDKNQKTSEILSLVFSVLRVLRVNNAKFIKRDAWKSSTNWKGMRGFWPSSLSSSPSSWFLTIPSIPLRMFHFSYIWPSCKQSVAIIFSAGFGRDIRLHRGMCRINASRSLSILILPCLRKKSLPVSFSCMANKTHLLCVRFVLIPTESKYRISQSYTVRILSNSV